MDNIKKKLKDYQLNHLLNIISGIKKNNIHIDGSDTGIGKTYIAIALASYLNYKPFIICPKTIINNWYEVSNFFNVIPLTIVNYETLIKGKTYISQNNMTRKKCEYLNYDSINDTYLWNLPEKTIVIFDEVHRCCSKNSNHNKLLMSTINVYNNKTYLLLISATITDSVNKFIMFGILLKWYDKFRSAPEWMLNKKYNSKRANELILDKVYPSYGSKVSIKDLGEKYPKRQISTYCYYLDDVEDINK